MWIEELCRATRRGDRDEVARLVDEEGVKVDSILVSVCVLCLLILVLFGIVWMDCSHEIFSEQSLGRVSRAIGSRSEPSDQE